MRNEGLYFLFTFLFVAYSFSARHGASWASRMERMETQVHEREPFGGCSRTNGEREDHNAGFRSGVAGQPNAPHGNAAGLTRRR